MLRRILVTVVLALLLTGAVPHGIAQAASEPVSPGEDATAPGTDWELFTDVDETGVSMVNVHENRTVSEWANTSYDATTDLFSYEYVRLSGEGDDRRRSQANVTLEVTAVYEYIDRNDNGRFDLTDEILGIHPLNSQDSNISRGDYPRQIEGATISYGLADGGSLDIELYTSPRVDFLGTRLILPSDAEFNLTVDGVSTSDAGSSYALQMRGWGGDDIHRDTNRVVFPSERAEAYVSWMKTAGGEPVGATVLEDKLVGDDGRPADQALILLSAPAGDRVTYGASIGAFTQPTVLETVVATLGSWPLYTLGLIATALIVGTAAAAKLQKDGSHRDPVQRGPST